ncbi:MAG: fibrobacter succinogenes major paralogous domain-containing protein [Fibrobacter sp.]|nr:fibrobacter succinogenes major paralogous domain-containing protein [Fibrobacter sp.]
MNFTKLFVGAFALSAMLVACAKDTSSSITTATPCNVEGENNCVYGTLTDTRDDKTYKTVTIGDQTWMAENLNYETGNSYCYDNNAGNCTKYGRLYTWAAAKKACPEGWHLPSDTEFETLFTAVGGRSTLGAKLKSQTGWRYKGNGTDSFGFSALPAGTRFNDVSYLDEGYIAYFWSSTEIHSGTACHMYLFYATDYAGLDCCYKYYGFSVRCVKD